MSRQCLNRCIPDRETMCRDAAFVKTRIEKAKTVNRGFTTWYTRIRLKLLYPSLQKS